MSGSTNGTETISKESFDYGLRPIVFDAAQAHRDRIVEYHDDGVAVCRHPELAKRGYEAELVIPCSRQFPAIRATFDDLNKALSRLSNSPLMEGGRTLRQLYEEEAARYDALASAAYDEGKWEPDYGSYVVDHAKGDLYLVAPERWHRLALVTSNAMLLTDPSGRLSWRGVRARLEGAVVGFAGVSVGGSILAGYLRDARPAQVKLADPDWVEVTNLNRGERMSLRHVVGSRAQRFDPRNPHETPRVSKAELIAYEMALVDPYTRFHVYGEGLNRNNIERFLLGDGAGEPGIEVLVEEMDDVEMKILIRQICREHGIDVVMATDFGHRTHVMWNHFRADPKSSLGFGAPDDVLLARLAAIRTGGRTRFFDFLDAICGKGYTGEQFEAWMEGRGEQPTASVPQSGATTMAAGAILGKEVVLHLLGHHTSPERRVAVYDFLNRTALEA